MSNALLALIAQRKAQTSRLKTIKPAAGRNRYRILPSWRKDDSKGPRDQFWMDFGQHFIKDAAGQVKAVYVCVDKTYGRPCQICDEVNRGIQNSVDDIQKKRLEDARSSGRVLLNVLHLDGQTPNEVQVLELAPSAFNGKKGVGGVLSLFQDWPNMVALTPGEGAADIIIEKSGQGMDTAYGVSAVPSQTTVTPAHLEKLHDLDAFVAQENDQGAQRALAGVSAITGLLPAPARPQLSASAAAAFAAPAAAQTFEDVPDFPTAAELAAAATASPAVMTPPPAAAPVQQPVAQPTAAAAPVAQPTAAVGEQDLMALLQGL
jgi:hypothetical protein